MKARHSKGATVNKSRRVALYALVSTDDQTSENQLRELRAVAERHNWTIVAEFVDHGISGAKGREQRPQFDALLRGVARRQFDMVAAWSVDRLGRSLQHLVACLSELQAKKVALYLHQQALDTSTPAGEAMFGMLGVFAQFERAIIQERVRAGLARTRAKGTVLGRPMKNYKPRQKADLEQRIRELRAQDMGKGKIARNLGIGVSVVQRVLSA
jgi:DNA invertase Pin-like site-specific DNA recombinase